MNSDLLCTTLPVSTEHVTSDRGPRLTRKTQFAGGWRPLSTDPAIAVPVLVPPAGRTR